MDDAQLHRLPLAFKLGLTLFCAALAFGLLASTVLISQSLHGEDDLRWPSLESIRLKYAAAPLERAVRTHMAQYLDSPAEAEALVNWCRAGGERTDYYQFVAPLIDRRCLRCHGGESTRGDVDLSTWGDLAPLSLNRGPTTNELLLSSHLHLFGIGLLILVAGALLTRSRWRREIRFGLPLLALFGLLSDIGAWWLSRHFEAAAVLVLIGGMLMVGGLATSLGLAVVDMWRPAAQPQSDEAPKSD